MSTLLPSFVCNAEMAEEGQKRKEKSSLEKMMRSASKAATRATEWKPMVELMQVQGGGDRRLSTI